MYLNIYKNVRKYCWICNISKNVGHRRKEKHKEEGGTKFQRVPNLPTIQFSSTGCPNGQVKTVLIVIS